jgi:hypothetical protein
MAAKPKRKAAKKSAKRKSETKASDLVPIQPGAVGGLRARAIYSANAFADVVAGLDEQRVARLDAGVCREFMRGLQEHVAGLEAPKRTIWQRFCDFFRGKP